MPNCLIRCIAYIYMFKNKYTPTSGLEPELHYFSHTYIYPCNFEEQLQVVYSRQNPTAEDRQHSQFCSGPPAKAGHLTWPQHVRHSR
jgi:hypothetical protein